MQNTTQPDTTDKQERDYLRLCNAYLLAKELFPAAGDKTALILAGALIRVLFKESD